MDYKDAFHRVEKEEAYIVDVLRKLVAVDTTVPPGHNYGELSDVMAREFERFGLKTERVVMPEEKVREIPYPLSGERVNLVARMGNGKPKASVYAHTDVVPIDEPWTFDPFGGEVADGKLYGRGVVDMKGSIACLLGAIKVLHDLGVEPNFDLECLMCADEEIGVYPGARYLAEEGYFSDHIVWLELGTVEPVAMVGSAGAISIDVVGVGKSCHSGMNWLGVNAVEEMIPIMQELMDLKAVSEKRLSAVPALPIPGNPNKMMTPMFNLNIIRGGTKDNIVPGECTLTVQRRYIAEENYEDVRAEILEAVERGRKKSKLLDVRVVSRHVYPPVAVDRDTPAFKRMLEARKIVNGYEEFTFGGLGGSTDLGFVWDILKDRKPEVSVFGLIRGQDVKAHTADEFVYVKDLVDMTKELVYYFAFAD